MLGGMSEFIDVLVPRGGSSPMRLLVPAEDYGTVRKLLEEKIRARQLTMEKAGLNPYLFTMTNIRDQCSWVHATHKEEATAKAMDLARMAVARARLLAPLQKSKMDVVPNALLGEAFPALLGLNLGDQGFQVYLAEKSERLAVMRFPSKGPFTVKRLPFLTDFAKETHPKIGIQKPHLRSERAWAISAR
jgi:hypothetical protein